VGYTRIEVEPATNTLGAFVRAIDLREPLDDETVSELTAAWHEHKVLFLRDQSVSRDDHKRFALYFGEILHHPFQKDIAPNPDFFELYSGGDTGARYVASNWHTDITFNDCPPMGSILRAVEVPEYGGDTMWMDLEAAYAALSEPMQAFLGTLTARHSAPRAFFVPGDTSGESITNHHPVIRTHPVTGRKCLFVNPSFTRSIDGLSRAESAALLQFLHRHCEQPELQVRLHWEKDTIAMWDNRCTQHRVVADNLDALRKMERITLAGERPV
jgi:taurine dioxygenase